MRILDIFCQRKCHVDLTKHVSLELYSNFHFLNPNGAQAI